MRLISKCMQAFSFFFSLSPSNFNSGSANVNVWNVLASGFIGNSKVTDSRNIRPVINLSSNVTISGGDGTAVNPYIVTLSNTD